VVILVAVRRHSGAQPSTAVPRVNDFEGGSVRSGPDQGGTVRSRDREAQRVPYWYVCFTSRR
jgi:hypothetical protein